MKKDKRRCGELLQEGDDMLVRQLYESALHCYYLAMDTAPQNDPIFYVTMKRLFPVLISLDFPSFALRLIRRMQEFAKLYAVADEPELCNQERLCETSSDVPLFRPSKQELYKGGSPLCAQLSAAVKVAYSQRRGRHLLAREDIPAGSVVILEKPIVMCTIRRDTHCSYCSHLLPLSFLPCEYCEVRFCDEDCRDRARSQHSVTCSELPGGLKLSGGGLLELAVAALFRYSRSEIEQCFRVPLDRRNVSALLEGGSFAAIMALMEKKMDKPSSLEETCRRFAKQLAGHLSASQTVGCDEGDSLDHREKFIFDTLFAVASRVPLNAHVIAHEPSEWLLGDELPSRVLSDAGIQMPHSYFSRCSQLLSVIAGDDDPLSEIASCLLPVVSIANHSCIPNIMSSFSDEDDCCMVLRTTRDVRAGEELVHNYGCMLGVDSFAERKQCLKERYEFDCDCEACEMEGLHPVDFVFSCRRCCVCEEEFLSSPDQHYVCDECLQEKKEFELLMQAPRCRISKVVRERLDVDLGAEDWDWDEEGVCNRALELFNRAKLVYRAGSQQIGRFATSALIAAMKNGCYAVAEEFVGFVMQSREFLFGSGSFAALGNAYALVAVFEFLRMRNNSEFRTRDRMKKFRAALGKAEEIFGKVYGKSSVRCRDIDELRQRAKQLLL